jgi:hypothetical protein
MILRDQLADFERALDEAEQLTGVN